MVETKSRASIGPEIVTSSASTGALINQHVWPARGDSLVLNHIIVRHSKLDLIDVLDGMRRVAYVFVERRAHWCRAAARMKALRSPENRASGACGLRGGQWSYFFHSLVPVSKTQASGKLGEPLPFR